VFCYITNFRPKEAHPADDHAKGDTLPLDGQALGALRFANSSLHLTTNVAPASRYLTHYDFAVVEETV
jgi:hypothetical protein